MKAYILRASGTREEAKPAKGKTFPLDQLQEIVGGTIDIVRLPDIEGDQVMVLNDNGRLEGLARNAAAEAVWSQAWPRTKYPHNNDGIIVGDVLVCERRMVG